MSNQSVFAAVVGRSGLSSLFADSAIRRACERIGVAPERLVPGDIPRLLPELEKVLAVFLQADQVRERLVALRALEHSNLV